VQGEGRSNQVTFCSFMILKDPPGLRTDPRPGRRRPRCGRREASRRGRVYHTLHSMASLMEMRKAATREQFHVRDGLVGDGKAGGLVDARKLFGSIFPCH